MPKSIKFVFRAYYGYNKEHICKECKHCHLERKGKKRVYKCSKIGDTSSSATDIRLKDVSCSLYEKKEYEEA